MINDDFLRSSTWTRLTTCHPNNPFIIQHGDSQSGDMVSWWQDEGAIVDMRKERRTRQPTYYQGTESGASYKYLWTTSVRTLPGHSTPAGQESTTVVLSKEGEEVWHVAKDSKWWSSIWKDWVNILQRVQAMNEKNVWKYRVDEH